MSEHPYRPEPTTKPHDSVWARLGTMIGVVLPFILVPIVSYAIPGGPRSVIVHIGVSILIYAAVGLLPLAVSSPYLEHRPRLMALTAAWYPIGVLVLVFYYTFRYIRTGYCWIRNGDTP
jgi:hypothetical protein